MSRIKAIKEDQQLRKIREAEERLRQMEREYAEIPKRLEREIKERECTMPPLAEIQERQHRRYHEEKASRGEVANCLRVQNRSILLLILFLTATASLIWWGFKLMQG
jgi:hypothetical protein